MEASEFQKLLYRWHAKTDRNLPWKTTRDPYKIWLSEIILQQTRVAQGLPYYLKFVRKYPGVQQLSDAVDEDFMADWEGLGYYSRARNALKAARIVSREKQGKFPTAYDELLKLPGIGSYTAAAISSFTADEPRAVVDGNVQRVLSRLYGIMEPVNERQVTAKIAELANLLLDREDPGAFNQAIMDFGALQCVPKGPDCTTCPFMHKCEAYNQDLVSGIPVKRKPAPRKKRYFVFYWMELQNKIRILKRESQDVWKDLYTLPGTEVSFDIFTQKTDTQHKLLYSGRQILSHQEIYIMVYSCHTSSDAIYDDQGLWIEKDKLYTIAMPKIMRSFVNSYLEDVNLC